MNVTCCTCQQITVNTYTLYVYTFNDNLVDDADDHHGNDEVA